jgi:uncharacterized protein (DUF849 family)
VIEAALNGATLKTRNPNVPRTPAEVTADALACIGAGASIVHSHTDDAVVGGPTRHDHRPYLEAWEPVLTAHPDVLLYPTMPGGSGPLSLGGAPIDERYAHVVALWEAGALRMALADPGTFALAGVRPDGRPSTGRRLYENTAADVAWMFAWCAERDLPVSLSIFEPGFLRLALAHLEAGTLPAKARVLLYFGGPRTLVGLPPTQPSLDAYLAMLDGTGLAWAVGVPGGDVLGTGLAAAVIERGGNVRVGLEDYEPATADRPAQPTNAALVTEVALLGASLGRPAAAPA